MKGFLFILIVATISMGCKKDKNFQENTDLPGNWELRQSVGGIAGINKVYAPGNGNTLQFNADNTFIAYQQFKLVNHGTYHIVKNGISIGGSIFDALYYNNASNGIAMQLQKDTLTIGVDYTDMVASIYVRQ